jgi:hypothetical protein
VLRAKWGGNAGLNSMNEARLPGGVRSSTHMDGNRVYQDLRATFGHDFRIADHSGVKCTTTEARLLQ